MLILSERGGNMKTKKITCGCGSQIEYKATEIIRKEIPNGRKDITGNEVTDIDFFVRCGQCNSDTQVFDKLDITGEFLD
jgi:hypothetical protein